MFEAFFLPALRKQLLRVDDVMNRRQLDARNSPACEKSLYEAVADAYNTENWVPNSITSDVFDHRLKTSHKLFLCGEKKTAEQIKRDWCAAKGELKKCEAAWRTSGNGNGNLTQSEDGKECHTLDDRGQFIQKLNIGYLWMLMDFYDCRNIVIQSLSKDASFSSTNENATSSSTSVPVPRGKGRKAKEAEAIVSAFSSIDKNLRRQNDNNVLRVANNQVVDYRHLIAA